MRIAGPRTLHYWLLSFTVVLLLFSGALSISTSAQEDQFAGERVVHLLQEPRHRTVHHEGDLYLLDVQVNAGDVSFPHIHDQAILLTSISRGDGPRDGGVSSIIEYATEALTHKVSNDGPGLLRIIALVNDGPGNANLTADRPTGLQSEPQLEDAWFRSYRIDLEPGEETSILTHSLPSVVVQVTEGIFHVTRSDGITSELSARAEWAWSSANESYSVRNVGDIASTIVINEGRR